MPIAIILRCYNLKPSSLIIVAATRATDRSLWIRGVWACASLDTDWALDLAERFSRRTTAGNYGEEPTFNQARDKISFGTMIHWLREDNEQAFEAFKELRRSNAQAAYQEEIFSEMSDMLPDYGDIVVEEKPQNVVKSSVFDWNDEYLWMDFIQQYSETVFESYDALIESFAKDLPRVFARVDTGKKFALFKSDRIHVEIENWSENLFDTVCRYEEVEQKIKRGVKGKPNSIMEDVVVREIPLKTLIIKQQFRFAKYNKVVVKPNVR